MPLRVPDRGGIFTACERQPSRLRLMAAWLFAGLTLSAVPARAVSREPKADQAAAENRSIEPAPGDAPAGPLIYITEYRVRGAHLLPADEVGDAVYPFLGPERTAEDVEQARAALEKAYKDRGFQTVTVEIPAQRPQRGVIILNVVENKVGRLRVKGARWYLPSDIKEAVPSLAEGSVPNFNEVQREIVALNQLADRRVIPVLKEGSEPGTVDIDLNVKDKFPLHGSIELNNRYSPDTVPLRLNGSISYNNLWQWGHSAGFSFQIAPERPEDATVYTAYYLARIPNTAWNLMLQGVKQDSDVSTLGGAAVAGRGEIIGFRFMRNLKPGNGFFHSASFGLDYKNFDEDVVIGEETFATPIEYYPISGAYTASWVRKKSFSEFNGVVSFHMRDVIGSDPIEFDNKRYNAEGSYVYFRGDASHTHDLPGGFQVFGKVQGQATDSPMINSEQFAAGGLATVRGYLESEVLGDSALFGTVEFRSPSLLKWLNKPEQQSGVQVPNEWRVYAFFDGGRVWINDPLPDEKVMHELASWGFGSRMRLMGHLNGSIDAAWPLRSAGTTLADDLFVSFRVFAEF